MLFHNLHNIPKNIFIQCGLIKPYLENYCDAIELTENY